MTARERLSNRRASTFRVTLCAARGADDATAIRALRAILKIAWRRFGLRAVDVHEIRDPPDDPTGTGRP
jgi:hypothetical protein